MKANHTIEQIKEARTSAVKLADKLSGFVYCPNTYPGKDGSTIFVVSMYQRREARVMYGIYRFSEQSDFHDPLRIALYESRSSAYAQAAKISRKEAA